MPITKNSINMQLSCILEQLLMRIDDVIFHNIYVKKDHLVLLTIVNP